MAKGNAIAAAVLASAGNPGSPSGGPAVTGGLSPLVASYVQQYSVNRPYSPLPRPIPTFLEGAFGPGSPIVAMPIDPPREDTQRPDVRRFQYPVNWNFPVGTPGTEGYKLADFATLRSLADNYSLARACVDKRKSEIIGLEWDIIPTDEAERAMVDDDKARADFEKRRAIVKEFFAHPDSDRAKYPTFGSWLNALLEDRFVIDAVAIHLVPPRKKGAGPFGSDIASLDLIDGSTIRPMLNTLGATPKGTVAYQAYEWGVPRVDLMSVINGDDLAELGEPAAKFRADQLIYMRECPRAFSPYGLSCVEKALLPIRIGFARQEWRNLYYQDGSIPGMFITPGPDISSPQQIRQLQDALNALANDLSAKHRIIVLPPGSKADPQKSAPLADQTDEWIAAEVSMPFGLTPMDIGITPRVSAVQTPSESRELSQINSDKGSQTRVEPVCADLKAVIFDFVIQDLFKQKDMQFSWGLKDRGKNRQAVIDQGVELVKVGGKTLDEFRIDLGEAPYGLPETSVPLVYTATGAVPVQAIASEEPQPAVAGAPQQGALPPGQPQQQPGQPQQVSDDELTTPAHEAAEKLPDTPDKTGDGKAGAEKSAGEAAELEILARYLRKGRDPQRFRADWLPAEALEAAARALPEGVPAAVRAAKAAASAKHRQDRRDAKVAAAAAAVTARLGRLVASHKQDKLSTAHVVDQAVGVMATGYQDTMTAGTKDAAADYDDTPEQDPSYIGSQAQDAAEGQRGYFTGLLQDIMGGLSIAATTSRLGLYADTLRRQYNVAYGTTVVQAHPDYYIVWELGDSRDHCAPCVARAGKKFKAEDLPGWPGDGGFGGPGALGQQNICLGGPRCACSVSFVQNGQVLATGTNTQRDQAGPYYQQQLARITAARQQAQAARQQFLSTIPSGPAMRAATRDQLRQQVADLANQRIRAAGGYQGVSVEPQDIPAKIIAQMLPPSMAGAAGSSSPRINVAQAVELMFAKKSAVLDMTKAEFTVIVKAAIAEVAAQNAPKASPQRVYDQLAVNYRPEGISWVRELPWRGPLSVPLDRIDWDHLNSWAAAHDDSHVAHFKAEIQAGRPPAPPVMVQVPGSDTLKVIDGHHRSLAYKELEEPVPAWVGIADSDAATSPWFRTWHYQLHSGGDPLNKRRMVSKESVNYRPATDPARSCGTCGMFGLLPPDFETGRCDLVKGLISPDATCDEWIPDTGTAKALGDEDPSRVAFLLIRAVNDEGKWRYLLQLRNDGTWGVPGGKCHDGEVPWDAAVREAGEELGDLPPVVPSAVWTRLASEHVIWTYLVELPDVFAPSGDGETSEETAGYGWFRRKDVPDLDLHPAMADTWGALEFGEPFLGGTPVQVPASAPESYLPAVTAAGQAFPGVSKETRGYELNLRSAMISLDLPEGLIPQVPGGVNDAHVTLVYLGPDVDDNALAEACRRADEAALAMPGPLSGVISDLGTFEPSGSSDGKVVAWAGVNVPGIDQLRAALEDLSASEHTTYTPHVTLAYQDTGDDLPEPVPPTPVTFYYLSVHRADGQEFRFPFGGGTAGD